MYGLQLTRLPQKISALVLAAILAAACAAPSPNSSVAGESDYSAKQRELDEIYSLLAMAVVLKDWQTEKVRGHNIGSVLVDPAGNVVFWARNTRYVTRNGTDHGEVRLIRNFLDCSTEVDFLDEPAPGFTVYSTLDPCAMCTGMMLMSKLSRAVYVQADPEYGEVAQRLAAGSETASYPPYPVGLQVSQVKMPEATLLDEGYRAWSQGDDITYYLRSEEARQIYSAAEQRLRRFRSEHGNQERAEAAVRYLDEVVDAEFQSDMSLECPPAHP